MSMISLGFRRTRRDPMIAALYGVIVAQARAPAFYRDLGVPDTVLARIDMIMLHMLLVLRRLRQNPQSAAGLGQELFDRFCQDMDDNFREMGVGDLKVPKEMQRIAGAFYGRAKVYDAALDAGDTAALAAAVARNIFDASEPPLGARRLADYIQQAASHLERQPDAMLLRAELIFPNPEIAAAEAGGR